MCIQLDFKICPSKAILENQCDTFSFYFRVFLLPNGKPFINSHCLKMFMSYIEVSKQMAEMLRN